MKKKRSPLEKIKYIIGVAAGKGGVGKSSVTVNLADALHKQGYRVGVLDTDIYGPSIRRMLPEDRIPVQQGEVITPALCRGIKMISMAYFRREGEAAVVRAPIANGIIQQFLNQVDWGELDYLLIDFPPGTGDVQLTLSQHAHLTGAIIVTTPQEVALLDVRKAMHMFHQVRIPILGIVENMSYYWHEKTQEMIYVFGKGGGEKLAQESAVPLLGNIPLHPELCACGDQGVSIFQNEDHPAAKAFHSVCHQLIEQLNRANPSVASFDLTWKE